MRIAAEAVDVKPRLLERLLQAARAMGRGTRQFHPGDNGVENVSSPTPARQSYRLLRLHIESGH
jgi:hypothetical protein